MKKISLFVISLFFGALISGECASKTNYTDYVDPQIGTAHCRWFHFTPGAVPFGMAKVAPSTNVHGGNKTTDMQSEGYDPRDNSIEGFANFHENQIGGLVIAPMVGELKIKPGNWQSPDDGYRSRFDKKDEISQAGYYCVLLKDYGVKAELTATQRVAYHRYTFPKSESSHIIFDVGNRQGESGKVLDAHVELTKDGRIEGFVITEPTYVDKYQHGANVPMFFSAQLDRKPASFGYFNNDGVIVGVDKASGVGAGIYLTFKTKANESINLKVGLSYTSIENARLNFETEARRYNFDQVRKAANESWNQYLSRIDVQGGQRDDMVKFYTGLYHALLGRGLASDVNGDYPKNDGTIGRIECGDDGKPKYHHYNSDAVWGAYWNLTQLWTLVYPECLSEWINSQLLVYTDSGWLGDGIACSKFISGVGTNMVSIVIAAAYNCGIRDFDIEKGYAASFKNEVEWRGRVPGAGKMDIRPFVERGYAPYVPYSPLMIQEGDDRGSRFGASHTLEYSFSSYAVAMMAKQLGKTEDYELLMRLSNSWKTLYDSQTTYIRPRDEQGKFLDNFNPMEPWRGFQEGNACQYTFFVPHDIETLIDTLGRDEFNSRLDNIFTNSQKNIFGGGTTVNSFSGLEALYNHGNQPCLHIPWLFNFSGKPHLTQKWTRAICDEFYGTEPIHGYGFGQDEDQGQLGAWYVMSAMGLFDIKGLSGENPAFQLGSPMFDHVTVKLSSKYYNGGELHIHAGNNSKTNVYVKSVKFNGKTIESLSVPFDQITKGGKLEFEMSPQAN